MTKLTLDELLDQTKSIQQIFDLEAERKKVRHECPEGTNPPMSKSPWRYHQIVLPVVENTCTQCGEIEIFTAGPPLTQFINSSGTLWSTHCYPLKRDLPWDYLLTKRTIPVCNRCYTLELIHHELREHEKTLYNYPVQLRLF